MRAVECASRKRARTDNPSRPGKAQIEHDEIRWIEQGSLQAFRSIVPRGGFMFTAPQLSGDLPGQPSIVFDNQHAHASS